MAPSTPAAADGDDAGITVHLSLTSAPSAPRAPLALPHGASASDLRRKASAATSVPLPAMKLIFRGRVIPAKDEGDVAAEFKLEEGCVVHVMGKPANNEASASGAGGSATASPATAGASVTVPRGTAPAPAASANSPLAAALAKLRSSNDGPAYRTAVATADKLLGNVVSHPMEEKYRTIKKSNPAFARRLGGLPGGSELMSAAGFTVEPREGVEYYVLTPSADAWPTLVGAREEVGRVLAESNRVGGAGTAAAPPPPAGAGGAAAAMPGGLPGFPGGMPDANEMSQLQNMLGDPNMMQSVMGMMNNPMVQNMMRSDPRFANNPMLQQSLNALQSNPDMMNQFSQMMSDPNARNRMASMMQQQQPGAGAGGANPFGAGPEAMRRQMEQFQQMSSQFGGSSGGFNTGGGTPGAAPSSSGTAGGAGNAGGNNSSGSVGGSGDSEMTEEEMIAEAIARSLRES